MTAVPEGTTWCVFNEVTEIKTANGGMFYMLRHRPYIPVCRIDQRFSALLENELELLRAGESVEIACIPDTGLGRTDDWRISLKYYEVRYAEQQAGDDSLLQLPTREATKSEPRQSKKITVDLPIQYHKTLEDLHADYKLVHDDCPRFGDFLAKLLTHQLEPFQWRPTTPF